MWKQQHINSAQQAENKRQQQQQQPSSSKSSSKSSSQAVAAANGFLPTRCFRERLRENRSIDYGTNRVRTVVAQEPVCQTKHDQAFDLKNQCAPIASTNKLQTSTVAMSLQFIFIFLPHWNLQASVKLNNYKPTLSFPKTLEQLLKKSEKENSGFHEKGAYARLPTQIFQHPPTQNAYTTPTPQAEQPPRLLNSSLFV